LYSCAARVVDALDFLASTPSADPETAETAKAGLKVLFNAMNEDPFFRDAKLRDVVGRDVFFRGGSGVSGFPPVGVPEAASYFSSGVSADPAFKIFKNRSVFMKKVSEISFETFVSKEKRETLEIEEKPKRTRRKKSVSETELAVVPVPTPRLEAWAAGEETEPKKSIGGTRRARERACAGDLPVAVVEPEL